MNIYCIVNKQLLHWMALRDKTGNDVVGGVETPVA